jgi:transposase
VVAPVTLNGADHRRAHNACHAAAGLWNQAVDWVHEQWAIREADVSRYEIRAFLTSMPPAERPLHAHTTEEIAYDLKDAIATARVNRRAGMKVRSPWRRKNYRPLSFTAGYGWRVRDGRLILSLGRSRPPLTARLPVVTDPVTGRDVAWSLWGEIRLCWDRDARAWSLRIAVSASLPPALDPAKVTAIDEGIINPVTLAAFAPESAPGRPIIDVTVVNGREGRAIKRDRNKVVGALARKMSRCADGSRRLKHLRQAKKKANARARARLRDFNHQVSAKAAGFIQAHDTGTVTAGDVRGIERKTRAQRRANRRHRQQLSQWDRGVHEALTGWKTGVPVGHVSERGSSKTCPACLTRNRPSGRSYRCRDCGFTCHRDAVGAINILMRASYGDYRRIDPGTVIRVTYLRAVERWSPGQRDAHSSVQRRKARALGNAPNRAGASLAAGGVAGRQACSSATVSVLTADPAVVAA